MLVLFALIMLLTRTCIFPSGEKVITLTCNEVFSPMQLTPREALACKYIAGGSGQVRWCALTLGMCSRGKLMDQVRRFEQVCLHGP